MKVSINTSADDLLSSFKCSIERHSIEEFEEAVKEELQKTEPRKTVIKLLHRVIRNKKNGARFI